MAGSMQQENILTMMQLITLILLPLVMAFCLTVVFFQREAILSSALDLFLLFILN
jgi:hypothetical protein